MQERFKPRLDGDFSLHYEDPDIDGDLCLLVDIQELPEKGTLRVVRPEGDTSSAASSDTDILPQVPVVQRQKSWPDHFVVPGLVMKWSVYQKKEIVFMNNQENC